MNNKTRSIVGVGLLTAIVIVLQSLAIAIRFGVFNITLVLVPIVVGSALYGVWSGAWLGFIFGVVVLFTDASAFMAVNIPGTIITCILKGVLAGICAGSVYKFVEQKSKNQSAAVITSGIIAPIVNTGVFLIGCRIFFYDTIAQWGEAAGFKSAGAYMIGGLVGVNFIVELVINLVLSSVIVRIIQVGRKQHLR